MVFLPAKEAGTLPPIPDSIPLSEFMLTDLYGRNPLGYSRDPFTCGITGKSFSALEVVDRVDYLSRALSKELNWSPNAGTEWDKTLAIFSLNTVSFKPHIGTMSLSLPVLSLDRYLATVMGRPPAWGIGVTSERSLLGCRAKVSAARF